MDKDQQLLKGEVKVASSVVWKQTDDHKMLQGRICEMWKLAGLGLEGKGEPRLCNWVTQKIVLSIRPFYVAKTYTMMV